jgi:hypothetical protein
VLRYAQAVATDGGRIARRTLPCGQGGRR